MRGILILSFTALLTAVAVKLGMNSLEHYRRESLTARICQTGQGRAQVGALREVYDHAYSALSLHGSKEGFAILIEGSIKYGPRFSKSEVGNFKEYACAYKERPDLRLALFYPKTRVFDLQLTFIALGIFFLFSLGFNVLKIIFERAVTLVHKEFSHLLADVFDLEPKDNRESFISRFLSKFLLSENRVINQVKSDLNSQKIKLEEATLIQREALSLSNQVKLHKEKHQHIVDVIRRTRHDIRSPMTFLKVFGNSLIEQKAKHADLHSISLNKIDHALRDLEIDEGFQVNLAKETSLQVTECLIEEVLQSKREIWSTLKKVEFSFEFDQMNLNAIEVERSHFIRAIENILQNSFDALEDQGNIRISCFKDKDSVVIQVKDDGRGISENLLKRLGQFELSFGKTNGNGIGLVSAKSWIEKWGGSLSISSMERSETTVKISLPKAETSARFIASLPKLTNQQGVVIVDDERNMGEALARKFAPGTKVFDSITVYSQWLDEVENPESYLHIFDLHLKHGTGLDLIEMSPWKENCVLYTFDYLNEEAMEKATEWRVPILPKDFIKPQSLCLPDLKTGTLEHI